MTQDHPSARDLYEKPDSDYLASEWRAIEKAARFRDPLKGKKDEKGNVRVLGYGWHIPKLRARPAAHPRPLPYRGAGLRYTLLRCCECHNHKEIEPRPKQVVGKPKKYQSIGIAFGNDKAGYGPRQDTKPVWKQLLPRWVPWIERATRAFEQAHPKPKEESEDSGYAPIDMEPRRGEFEINDHGRPVTGWGYQIEKDERAQTARRALRSEDIDSRSRGTVREQAKRDPRLLVYALTADPRAECAKVFKADDGAVAARAGLFEYALLPGDHRNWKERLLFRDPDQLPRKLRQPLERIAPPAMMLLHPRGNFLPSWGGALEFEVDDEGIIRDRPRRKFGDDPLQGYTRKKVDISGAVAIALKGESLPDEKMLAIVDIGGGARIGLRKTELKKPEIVVEVKPLDEEVLSSWRVGTLHKKKGSKTIEFKPLYPCECPEERPKIVVRGDPVDRGVVDQSFEIVVKKKHEHEAVPTRTLYTGLPESKENAKRFREAMKGKRDYLAKEKQKAKLALTRAIMDDLLEQPAKPTWGRWNRPIVKERILPVPAGMGEAELWLIRNATSQASEVECIERGYIVEGPPSAPPEIPRRPPLLVGAAFNFALPADLPLRSAAHSNQETPNVHVDAV